MPDLSVTTLVFALLGLATGILRDAARAKAADHAFDWSAWLGERYIQLGARLVIVVGLLAPEGSRIVETMLATVDIQPEVAKLPAPFLAGVFGDRIVKTVLEKSETVLQEVPGFKRLMSLGKKLT